MHYHKLSLTIYDYEQLILAIRSLILFHKNDIDIVTIKLTSHKP